MTPTFERLLITRRAEYEADIEAFFEKVWKRMKELGLITVEPYSASEAAQLILVAISSLLDIFDPAVPVPPMTQVSPHFCLNNTTILSVRRHCITDLCIRSR